MEAQIFENLNQSKNDCEVLAILDKDQNIVDVTDPNKNLSASRKSTIKEVVPIPVSNRTSKQIRASLRKT